MQRVSPYSIGVLIFMWFFGFWWFWRQVSCTGPLELSLLSVAGCNLGSCENDAGDVGVVDLGRAGR